MNENTCGQCRHFNKFGPEPKGECYFLPPTVTGNGFCKRPQVRQSEKACGQFDNSAPPGVKGKANPETPGHAAKAARLEKETAKPTE